jgi:hypothetical protein
LLQLVPLPAAGHSPPELPLGGAALDGLGDALEAASAAETVLTAARELASIPAVGQHRL